MSEGRLRLIMFYIFLLPHQFPTLQVYSRVCVLSVWPNRLFSSIWGVLVVCIEFIGPVTILIYYYGRIAWTLTRRIDSNLGTVITPSENIVNSKFLKARKQYDKNSLACRDMLYCLLGK